MATHSPASVVLVSPQAGADGQPCGPQRLTRQHDLFTPHVSGTTGSGLIATSDSHATSLSSTSSPADSPVRISVSQASVPVLQVSEAAYSLTWLGYFMRLGLSGSYLRTSLAFSRPLTVATCRPFSTDAPDSAQPSRSEDGATPAVASVPPTRSFGAFSMRGFSESPSVAVECSLSDILLTGDVPRRFYLSPRACAGILRRATKRGVKLPIALLTELQRVAIQLPTSTSLRRSRKGRTAMALRMIRRSWRAQSERWDQEAGGDSEQTKRRATSLSHTPSVVPKDSVRARTARGLR